MFKKPVWDDLWQGALSCWKYSSEEEYTVVIKGWTWSATILRLWCLNDAQLVLRGQKCAKKIPPTPLHHHHQPEPLRQGRMDPCFHVLYTKFWPYHLNAAEIKTHQIRQRLTIFYCPILVILCELYPPCAALIWQERHPVWCSAAVAHLLQGSTCCAFRDGFLHILVVTSGYLSYCCLSIISNQSAHSPLTSDLWHQQGIFVHTTAAHWIVSLFRTILCKL